MRQLTGGPGFQLEALESFGIRREPRGQRLDRDIASQSRITSAVHLAHAAGANQPEHVVGTELRAFYHATLAINCSVRGKPLTPSIVPEHDPGAPKRDARAGKRRIVEDVDDLGTNRQASRTDRVRLVQRDVPVRAQRRAHARVDVRRIAEREGRRRAPGGGVQPSDAGAGRIVIVLRAAGQPRIDPRDDVRPLAAAEQIGVVVVLEHGDREAALIPANPADRPSADDGAQQAAVAPASVLPGPNGSSMVPLMLSRCGASSSE